VNGKVEFCKKKREYQFVGCGMHWSHFSLLIFSPFMSFYFQREVCERFVEKMAMENDRDFDVGWQYFLMNDFFVIFIKVFLKPKGKQRIEMEKERADVKEFEGKIKGSKFHLSFSQQNDSILLSVVGEPSEGCVAKFKRTLTSQTLSKLLPDNLKPEKFPTFLKSCIDGEKHHLVKIRFEKGKKTTERRRKIDRNHSFLDISCPYRFFIRCF